ncbi:MAG: outer membrane protein assembly factor BamB family protein [Planctomycetota bacterium]|jgi:outer membrane protein assembly factor BamB
MSTRLAGLIGGCGFARNGTWTAVAAAALTGLGTASAQQENPVYVDDSPRAWELFRMARDQARANLSEAARLYQELLDDYAMKLLPISETSGDHFVAVRARVLTELMGNERLLERFRLTETAEAQRLLESGQWQRVAVTRSMTEPGLETLLRLAQDDLESARFQSALDWLWQAVDHPDLDGRRRAHCWYMIGAAAAYLDLPEPLAEAVETLGALGQEGVSLQAQLERLVAAVPPPPDDSLTPFDGAASADLGRLVAQPIWSIGLDDTPLSRRLLDPIVGERPSSRTANQLRRSGTHLTAAPTVAGSGVFVNEGRTIHAVDRFTGRPLWPPFVERRSPGGMEKGSRQIADLNVVALSGNALVTITGHAFADAARSERTIVCLDPETGRLRWASRVDRLSSSDELDGLFPYGAPVIGEGMVFVAARKVSRQLLTSCYVIALGLDDGRLRWARHVASSGGIRSRFARPFSTIVYDDGDLAVATAIGAVARIDATTGQTRWLRRYHPPLSPYLAERRPWEMSGPVITPRGIVAIRPDHRRVILLDWQTGDDLEDASATAREGWNSPRYLLADEQTVYAVGTEIRAFDLNALEQPKWLFPRSPDAEPPLDAGDVEIRGRVQMVEGALVVPTVKGLLILDGDTGDVVQRVDLDSVGNPLAKGPQLILAASDRLQAYMPLDRAEQMLRRQIAEDPADPAPALALMRLGARVRDLDLALEAAQLATRAIDEAPPDKRLSRPRRELFEILLELHHGRVPQTVERGEALYAMIGVVAQEPRQRVEYLLAYGDWLSDHALGSAVEAYQAILSAPVLAETPRRDAGLSRPAATWAAGRIGRLIEAHGPAVYQPQAEFARERLAMLRRGKQVGPDQLVALAREFPFSDSAVEAAISAARAYETDGRFRSGLAALTGMYRLAPGELRASALLGPVAACSEAAGWTGHAAAVIRYVVENFGPIAVSGDEARRDAAGWLAALTGDPERSRLPRVGDNEGGAERLAGTLVPWNPGATTAAPPQQALLYDPPQLALFADPAREPVWTADLGVVGEPSVLRFEGDGLLLWVQRSAADAAVVMMDPADGSQRWIIRSVNEVMGEPVRRAGAGAHSDLLPRGEPFDPAKLVPLAGGDALFIVRRSGEVLALDLADGRTQPWQRLRQRPLAEVHQAAVCDLALVLAGGRRTVGARDVEAAISVLDPRTGETLSEVTPLGGSAVRWMAIGPLGTLVYGNDVGVAAVELLSGGPVWSDESPEAAQTPRGRLAEGGVVVESAVVRPGEGANPLRAFQLGDGTRTDLFDAPDRGEWDRLDLRELVISEGRIFARYGQRIVRYSDAGTVLGADVVSDHRDYKWLLPAADRMLLVSRFKSEQVMVPAESRRRTEHTYRVYAMSENCRLVGDTVQLPPLSERVEVAAVIDNWLLLSTSSETLAVALPVEP